MDGSVAVWKDEAALAAQAVAEPAAFATIYDRYFARVYNYIRYRVEDADIADDLTSHVFERVIARIDSYRPERAPFAAWLFAIARHAVADHRRAERRRKWLSLDALIHRASPLPEPEAVAVASESNAEVLRAVTRLRERERDLIALKFAAGLSNREIARVTGLSASHVGVILYRTLRRLRSELEIGEDSHE
jgi:RNA polymerase sigma-70 factor (ECF subfamily)